MQVQNAINKLVKAGYSITQNYIYPDWNGGQKYLNEVEAVKGNAHISFYVQADGIDAIYVKRRGAEDDLTTDSFCGNFCDNLTEAIRNADRLYNRPAA